jgi:hypothetical protein
MSNNTLNFSTGSIVNPLEGLQSAIGDISKQYLQQVAYNDAKEERAAQNARLDAQERESARRFDTQMQAHSEDFNKTFGLQQAQENRAERKQQLELDEHNRLMNEREAYRNAVLNPATVRTPLQIAKEDVQTAISPIAGEMEKNLVGMTPEERKVAMEGAINPLTGAALKSLTTEDYKAREHDRLFDAYRSKGVPPEKIEELVTQQLDRGIQNDPSLLSRADVTASLRAKKDDAEKAYKAELDTFKSVDGNSKLGIGENGEITVNTGKGAFSVGSKPMDALRAGEEYQKLLKGSNWVLSDPGVRDFAAMRSTAAESLAKNGFSQKDIDKALTSDVLSNFVAAGGDNPSKLADLMLTQIDLNRNGLGSEVGKDRSRLMAAKNAYQELLSAEKTPSYITALSALRDASEPRGLLASTEAVKDTGLARGVLPQPTVGIPERVDVKPAQTELKPEMPDTDPTAYQALQSYVSDPSKGPSKEALLEAADIARKRGVSDRNIAYMVDKGDMDALLDRAASKGNQIPGKLLYGANQAINNIGTAGLEALKYIGAGLYGLGAPAFTDASVGQATEEANKYLGLDNTRKALIAGDNAFKDGFLNKKELLALYGLNLPEPSQVPKDRLDAYIVPGMQRDLMR